MFHKTFSFSLAINHCYIAHSVSLISRSELRRVKSNGDSTATGMVVLRANLLLLNTSDKPTQ